MKPLVETRPGAFDSELSIQGAGPYTWRVIAPLIWNGTKGDTFTVPVGLVTDFATVPRLLRWLINTYGPYTRAAVLHDWLLEQLKRWVTSLTRDTPAPPATSRDIDGIFRRVMQDQGVPWAVRWLMWTGVRWGALASPYRAYGRGFAADAPRVLLVTVLALVPVLIGVAGISIPLLLLWLINSFTTPSARKRTATEERP